MFKKALSVSMTVLILHQMITGPSLYGQSQSDKNANRAAAIKTKAESLGTGAEVKVGLTNDRQLRGHIEKLADDSFRLSGDHGSWSLRYRDVIYLEGSISKYKARGQVDPLLVRQVALTVGVGNKARIELMSRRKLTGNILSIERDAFSIQDSKTGSPVLVQFNDVAKIGRVQFPLWATVTIVAGIIGCVVGVAILVAAVSGA